MNSQSPFRELKSEMEGRELYRTKNKKTRKRKIEKYLIGWGYLVNFVWGERPRVGLLFRDGLTRYTVFLIKRSTIGTETLSKF